jgi:putrescine transport system substrate-binding protein
MVYPPESVMKKLFVLEAMPLETYRLCTRIWSRVKNGQ